MQRIYKIIIQNKPKDFNDSDKNDDVVTHLETEILDYEIKWVLGSIMQTKLAEVTEF